MLGTRQPVTPASLGPASTFCCEQERNYTASLSEAHGTVTGLLAPQHGHATRSTLGTGGSQRGSRWWIYHLEGGSCYCVWKHVTLFNQILLFTYFLFTCGKSKYYEALLFHYRILLLQYAEIFAQEHSWLGRRECRRKSCRGVKVVFSNMVQM